MEEKLRQFEINIETGFGKMHPAHIDFYWRLEHGEYPTDEERQEIHDYMEEKGLLTR